VPRPPSRRTKKRRPAMDKGPENEGIGFETRVSRGNPTCSGINRSAFRRETSVSRSTTGSDDRQRYISTLTISARPEIFQGGTSGSAYPRTRAHSRRHSLDVSFAVPKIDRRKILLPSAFSSSSGVSAGSTINNTEARRKSYLPSIQRND